MLKIQKQECLIKAVENSKYFPNKKWWSNIPENRNFRSLTQLQELCRLIRFDFHSLVNLWSQSNNKESTANHCVDKIKHGHESHHGKCGFVEFHSFDILAKSRDNAKNFPNGQSTRIAIGPSKSLLGISTLFVHGSTIFFNVIRIRRSHIILRSPISASTKLREAEFSC